MVCLSIRSNSVVYLWITLTRINLTEGRSGDLR